MTWHVDESLLRRYAGGRIDQARAASVEAHVIACDECRRRVAGLVDPQRTDRIWQEVRNAVDAPRKRFAETVLVRLGVREHHARLIAATPALTLSWLAGVAIALAWAVVAAQIGTRGVVLFLMVAPMIPLAGIALAFGPRVDPTYEVGVASPMNGLRLLLLRAASVLGSAIVLTGVASIWLPAGGWKAAAWLLPAIGVSLSAMALSTWIEPVAAAGTVAFAWVSLSMAGAAMRRGMPALERLVAFEPGGQLFFAAIAVVAVGVLSLRGRRFDVGSRM